MAYFTGLRAVLEGIISPSLIELVEKIRSGSFDYVLLKPVDAQAMISASHYEPWKMFDMAIAIGMVIYAFWRRGTTPAPLDVALGIGLFFAGAIAMYSLWIVCAAASFWVGRLDNLMYLLGAIFDSATLAGLRTARRVARRVHVRDPGRGDDHVPGNGAARHARCTPHDRDARRRRSRCS